MNLSVKPDSDILYLYENHNIFHKDDAGLDLFCPETLVVPAKALAFTINFKIKCSAIHNNTPTGYFLAPRSSITKTPLRMSNSLGIIDAGYRGYIMAKVDNLSNEAYTIHSGDRLFQLVAPQMRFQSVKICKDDFDENTTRGKGGFGSTG